METDLTESAGQIEIVSETLNENPATILGLGFSCDFSIAEKLAELYAQAMTRRKLNRKIKADACFKHDQAFRYLLTSSPESFRYAF